MRRLDAVVGPAGWTFDFELLSPDGKMVKGKLSVLGVTKCDAGEGASEDEVLKSAVSDALKRCAVHFGIGRYLYYLPSIWAPIERKGNSTFFREPPRIPPAAVEKALTICGIPTSSTQRPTPNTGTEERKSVWCAGGTGGPESSGDQAAARTRARTTQAAQRAETSATYGDATGAPPGQRAAEVREQLPPKVQPKVGTAAELPPAHQADGMSCSRPDCGKPLTKGQHDVSIRGFGQPLCPACQKAQARASA
jgi:hypothetical protein